MHPIVDPLLTLQLLAAVLIVLTMPRAVRLHSRKANNTERRAIELADGNIYVEHAGMAIGLSHPVSKACSERNALRHHTQ